MLLNLAVEWGVLDRAPKVRGFREKHEYVAEDEYLTLEETPRFLEAVAPEWRTFGAGVVAGRPPRAP